MSNKTLRESLSYEPVVLNFGTSGRRGNVVDLTQLEVYINAFAELEYLKSLSRSEGGIAVGEPFYFACDLRPSSAGFVPHEKGRGEIAQAVEQAIRDAGLRPVNLGRIPTPALTSYAIACGKGSIMVTGSHIPFHRNGYKTNTSRGELLKKDEVPISRKVQEVRRRLYDQPLAESVFDEQGMFKTRHRTLTEETDVGRYAYVSRYVDFFTGGVLRGRRILVYQHSAVGRDMLVEILQGTGAEVIPVGRSEVFVPIDTENMDEEQLGRIRELAAESMAASGPVDAIVSTDGDSDRPLVLAVMPANVSDRACPEVKFFGGDLVGMVVAEYLSPDGVVVPISCNDAVDRGRLRNTLEPKTRIGSPFVIAGMEKARAKGKKRVCGWEANGGFLTGSDIEKDGKVLKALPTRDAMLPILAVLFASKEANLDLPDLFAALPKRYSKAALLKNFPRSTSVSILRRLSPPDDAIKEVEFRNDEVVLRDEESLEIEGRSEIDGEVRAIRERLAGYFRPAEGFGPVVRLNYVDGVRAYFDNGDIAHVRPSGNADELRIYAVADSQERADQIARLGVAEPAGILRTMERELG